MSDAGSSGDGADLTEHSGPAPPLKRARFISDRLRYRVSNFGAAIASVAAIGAVIGGLAGYWTTWKVVKTEIFHEGQSLQQKAASRPGVVPRLSLIVLPFANLSKDPEQDYFADGVTTDLTTDLAQIPGAFVIGRGTAFTYKNKPVDLKVLGKELGIRWAVQGAVQRTREYIRLNVSLSDLSTGSDFWSDRFDGDRSNLADLHDQVVARLGRSLNVELMRAESRRGNSEHGNPDAIDLTMRGWAKRFEQPLTQASMRQAIELFDNALQLDPGHVDAMIGKASSLATILKSQWSTSDDDLRVASDLIDRALAKWPTNALAHSVKGDTLGFGHPEAAIAEFDTALQLDPNYPPAYQNKGAALTLLGRSREALAPLQIALRLSPKDPSAALMHFLLCHAHLHLREYAEAIDECRRSINLNNLLWLPWVDLVVAYQATGQFDETKQALAQLYDLRPDFTVQRYQQLVFKMSSNPRFRDEITEIFVEGMRKAGVREH
ncbi:tetratricopeptide repeat protein [Bradyrhizobium sp. CIAT3101]|uniref:tetratricopeptide repeat protein n=1 Tax=Bradyrhizobium sp. CIAT3101 TaxID=439387 RepID=UPI0024B0D0D4|nr:tetratricopeptide repeat protein [Bradyrhizobium sp. CIAT3101]WFU78592.1 tetratricopeptide repeat protein [Bradyrhizobium sp. CIAT3101]